MAIVRNSVIGKDSTSLILKGMDQVTNRIDPSEFELKNEKLLGRGKDGAIYLSKWGNKEVAIKKIQYTAENIENWENEKSLMATLTNLGAEHVVEFFAYSMDISHYYILMEYMPGGSLFSYINKEKSRNCFDIIYQLAKAINFLHVNNFVHGDIKPENVLLTGKEENIQLKLCDFAFAYKEEEVAKAKKGGTVRTAAPEVLKGQLSKKPADVWSYGATILEVATGKIRIVFSCELDKRMKGKMENIPAECPPKVRALIERCWAPLPENRITAAEAVAESYQLKSLKA